MHSRWVRCVGAGSAAGWRCWARSRRRPGQHHCDVGARKWNKSLLYRTAITIIVHVARAIPATRTSLYNIVRDRPMVRFSTFSWVNDRERETATATIGRRTYSAGIRTDITSGAADPYRDGARTTGASSSPWRSENLSAARRKNLVTGGEEGCRMVAVVRLSFGPRVFAGGERNSKTTRSIECFPIYPCDLEICILLYWFIPSVGDCFTVDTVLAFYHYIIKVIIFYQNLNVNDIMPVTYYCRWIKIFRGFGFIPQKYNRQVIMLSLRLTGILSEIHIIRQRKKRKN